MRVAVFTPLPPARSGIADYSAALIESLRKQAEVDVFESVHAGLTASEYDAIFYQLGNNPFHSFVYDQLMAVPGIAVMHEANLHHLIADVTIRRDNWDAYMDEVAFDGGPKALEYAKRVRARQVGPDYEGVPMLRRVLSRSRGAIAHSRFVEQSLRTTGFEGPTAVIPHGAWLPEAGSRAMREKLGVKPDEPLFGMFGFLKPYKRIAESLRAFKRLVKVQPKAKLILVGEAHPEFPLDDMIRNLGLNPYVRPIGYAGIEDFVGYMDACDAVLNLRYPTVGETSGTLLRALGLGKPVIVSDVGAFAEYPDEVCLKVPVDASEEDTLLEYMQLLTTRPDLARVLGEQARAWVAKECNWDHVAKLYLEFATRVERGATAGETAVDRTSAVMSLPTEGVALAAHAGSQKTGPAPARSDISPDDIRRWAKDDYGREYIEIHATRLQHTLEITPRGDASKRVLEMGAYLQITPALQFRLGYGEVRGCYYGPAGVVEHRSAVSIDGEKFACDVDLFDAEKDRFPYPDGHFDTVLCCELLEHLPTDPMHMMGEINRILKPGGSLVLTTPNITSLRAISAILAGYHPGFFPAYLKPAEDLSDARHAREYAPLEIRRLFEDSGFELSLLETGEFREIAHPEFAWLERFLELHDLPRDLRAEGIYAVGQKAGPVRQRFPEWLYN